MSGIVGATVPPGPGWHRGQDTLVEAFPTIDGAAPGIQGVIDRVNGVLRGSDATLGGVPAVDRDFVHAVYGNFPYVLAFVLILTLVLLTRAFRSIVLPIKAAILNLVSLGAAYGAMTWVFQKSAVTCFSIPVFVLIRNLHRHRVESAARDATLRLEHVHNTALLFRCLARGAL